MWPPVTANKTTRQPSAMWTRRRVRDLSLGERRLQAQVAADPMHLHHFECSEHSQNGEDGIIAEIFTRIGSGTRSFIEVGASDGVENCTRALLERGWSGVWIEGDGQKALAARRMIGSRPVTVVHAFVDRESILAILSRSGAPISPDLLVIDLDGNDYWVWEAIAPTFKARVVVIEYNAVVGPRLNWVMTYDPSHRWDGTRRHGASLSALASLGSRLGYVLVGCDSQGVNAFFVRSSEAQGFSLRRVRGHFVGPRYGLPFGHPRHAFPAFEADPVPEGEAGLVRLRITRPRSSEVRRSGLVYVAAAADNGASVPIGSSASTPVQLANRWINEDGHRLDGEPERSTQNWRADPGSTAHLVGRAKAPEAPGRYVLEFALVQESVRWFDESVEQAGVWTVS